MSFRVHNEYLGYLPEVVFEPRTELMFVGRSSFTVAHLDTFIITVVASLCSNGADKV